jgi:hypothetical protein
MASGKRFDSRYWLMILIEFGVEYPRYLLVYSSCRLLLAMYLYPYELARAAAIEGFSHGMCSIVKLCDSGVGTDTVSYEMLDRAVLYSLPYRYQIRRRLCY